MDANHCSRVLLKHGVSYSLTRRLGLVNATESPYLDFVAVQQPQ